MFLREWTETSMEGQDNYYSINFVGLRNFIRNPKLSNSAKAVGVNLLLYAGVGGKSFPSEETLAGDHDLSDRQIRNLLKELKLFGFDWERGGFSKSNRYFFSEEIYFRNDKSIRKLTSDHIGNKVPVQKGNTYPTKVVSNDNHISSSHVQQIFENTSNKKCGETEIEVLHKLCEEYSEDWVIASIKEAELRNLKYLSVHYLVSMLNDWKSFGKPYPKPKFTPCNIDGCENGFVHKKEAISFTRCSCRETYEKEVKQWETQGRREFL